MAVILLSAGIPMSYPAYVCVREREREERDEANK
jgi:hypothetical protein